MPKKCLNPHVIDLKQERSLCAALQTNLCTSTKYICTALETHSSSLLFIHLSQYQVKLWF